MTNELAMFTAEATKNLILLTTVFLVCMSVATINIVHFHHRRARWQEALAAFVGAGALVVFGLYTMNYGTYGFQVLFQTAATTDTTGAQFLHMGLVNGSLVALAGASVCLFAGLLGIYGSFRSSAQPVMSAALS